MEYISVASIEKKETRVKENKIKAYFRGPHPFFLIIFFHGLKSTTMTN
jgi:hypothetical protein